MPAAVSADCPSPLSCDCSHSTSVVSSASNALPAAASFYLGLDWHGSRREPQRQRGRALLLKYLFERELVLAQQLRNRGLDQRGRETRNRRRLPAQNALEQHRRLRQVRNLRRPSHLRRGPKQKILKHRPQQRRRRNALRLGIENAQQIGR